MNVLNIGRYQVVHNGHADQFRQMAELEGIEKIIIGMGTTNIAEYTKSNPFSAGERELMLRPVLDEIAREEGIDYAIYYIPDINNPPKYAEHVMGVIPEFDRDTVIFSGNTYTTQCFNYNKIIAPKVRINVCATKVRDAIANDLEWKSLVPASTVEVIERINGVERIKQLYGVK